MDVHSGKLTMQPTPIPLSAPPVRGASGAHLNAPDRPPQDLMASARAFETAFLAEMLLAAGTTRTGEGAESGPSPFESFMAEAQARALVAAGGLGLTAPIAAALSRRADPAGAVSTTERAGA